MTKEVEKENKEEIKKPEISREEKGNGETSEKFDAVLDALKNISKDIHERKKKESSLGVFSGIFLILFLLGISYGGYWFYTAENKAQVIESVTENISSTTSEISQKISDVSETVKSNVALHDLQNQIEQLEKSNQEITSRLSEISETNVSLQESINTLQNKNKQIKEEQKLQKIFRIQTLQEEILFLQTGFNDAPPLEENQTREEKNPEISQASPEQDSQNIKKTEPDGANNKNGETPSLSAETAPEKTQE